MSLLGNMAVADVAAPFLQPLCGMQSEPSCKLIKPIVIDYNYIEVLPEGTCFNILEKSFQQQPNMKGSPRAFVKYVYDERKRPKPIPFIEGKNITNLPKLYLITPYYLFKLP